MCFKAVIERLQEGPAVLFLGQKYLSIESGTDNFLKQSLIKYGDLNQFSTQTYNSLLQLGLSNQKEHVIAWMSNLCKSLSAPLWLERIAKFQWSAVYTTAYDTILERTFLEDWREVQPISDSKYHAVDPRNKRKLHITYLNGYIHASSEIGYPALTNVEKIKRNSTSNELLRRLSNVVTPKGILIVEGYDVTDQLTVDDFYTYISSLGDQQVLICNASKELKENELIKELVNSKIAIVIDESFASLLNQWESDNRIKIEIPLEDEYYGKWLTINNEKYRLPQELINKVSKSAIILDDGIFFKTHFNNADEKYDSFRKFLSSTNLIPDWGGYPHGFAFKRDYFANLINAIINTSRQREWDDMPFILHGQSSSGKTVSLGLLAYELRTQYSIPVLYIHKKYERIDELNLDLFCKWAEENKAKHTVIIWDGMFDIEVYQSLLRKLNGRGRNVILVGSCYTRGTKNFNDNFFEAPIDLTDSEKRRFTSFVSTIDQIVANILSGVNDRNLLAMMYRFLPSTRSGIQKGLINEYEFFRNILKKSRLEQNSSKGILYDAFKNAGIITTDDERYLNEKVKVDSDEISISDLLIFSVMVPGKYGLNVPFELLLNTIGFEAFSSHIFKALKQINIIKWYDDQDGNVLLGPRTPIEAEILTKYLGGKKAEISYVKMLLKEVRSDNSEGFGVGWDYQVHFAVELLNKIGPNSSSNHLQYLYEITDELKYLREEGLAYHPRLVLKEASFLREIVKERIETEEDPIQILLRAEEMVRQALNYLGSNSERLIANYLRVELSAILGFLAKQYLLDDDRIRAYDYYLEVKDLNNYAFAANPGNYKALDILSWTTEELIKARVFSEKEKLEVEMDMISLFELAEAEGVDHQNEEDFYRRKYKFYDLIGNVEISEEAFNTLAEKGFASGYYIKAKKIIGFENSRSEIEKIDLKKYHEAFTYLNENFHFIQRDSRCLFLLLKTWWVTKTGNTFFGIEKQALAFSKGDWEYTMNILDILLASDSIYQSATIYYLKGLCQFHLEQYKPSIDTFRDLEREAYMSNYGYRRMSKFYVSSTDDGVPKLYTGEVTENVSFSNNQRRGYLYVRELNLKIPFSLRDFLANTYKQKDVIRDFHIAFNFLGPIAIPAKK